jgi:hypothetical protein
MTRYFLLFDIYGLVCVGRLLWGEDGSVICICCWPMPAQPFLGPSPLDGTRDHILLSQTRDSLFVASYDSQGHGGGIRPRLHTGSKFETTTGLDYIDAERTTQKTSHVIAISPVHWRPDCCLATSYNSRPIVACAYRGVFIEPLPVNAFTCYNTFPRKDLHFNDFNMVCYFQIILWRAFKKYCFRFLLCRRLI